MDQYLEMLENMQTIPEKDVRQICEKVAQLSNPGSRITHGRIKHGSSQSTSHCLRWYPWPVPRPARDIRNLRQASRTFLFYRIRIPTICSWGITWIGGSIAWRRSCTCSSSRSSIATGSPSWGATMKIGKSTNYTGSTMSAWRSTELSPSGSCSLKYSSTCHYRQWSRTRFSVFMEAYRLKSSS